MFSTPGEVISCDRFSSNSQWYPKLRNLLAAQKWQLADRETRAALCQPQVNQQEVIYLLMKLVDYPVKICEKLIGYG